jgi:hypothetical protein
MKINGEFENYARALICHSNVVRVMMLITKSQAWWVDCI